MRLTIFYILIPYLCFSQPTINAEQFFSQGLTSFEQATTSANENVKFPWIEQYELRTETSDFEFDRQEYTFRVAPSTRKIRNAQQALYNTMKNAPDADGQEIFCDLVLDLHSDWLTLFILNENKKVMDQLAIILADKQTVYEKMVGTLEFDPQKLLRLEIEKSEMEIELNEINQEQKYILDKYNIPNQEIEFGNFATVETITKYLANTSLLNQNESAFIDLATAHKQQLLTKEIELESAEKQRILDFAQLKYNGPHSDLVRERISMGLGFQLSTSGNTKLKIQELKIEQEELNRESIRNIQENKENINTIANKLQSDIQIYYHFQKTIEDERIQLQKLSSKIAQKEGLSPLFLLDIEERYLSMQIKSLNIKEDLLNEFLKYLHQSNKMCQTDFVNYLMP